MKSWMIALLTVAALGSGCQDSGDSHGHEGTEDHSAVSQGEEEHGEGESVRLTQEQATTAGVSTVRAEPGTVTQRLGLAAIVSPDLDAQAHVTPRISGLVHAVHVGLGQEVDQGDLLLEIESAELGRLVSAYITAHATVEMSEEILSGERVVLDRNVELAEEVHNREVDLADQGIATATARYAAEQRLQEAKLRRDSRILELEARLARDRIDLVAAERGLEILGVPHEALEAMTAAADEAHEPLGRYEIRAPRRGLVVMRDVSDAEFVDTESTVLKIQDLSTVWVLGSVYEQDLASVRVGASATVSLDAHPGALFEGEVAFIESSLSPTTRAASVRVVLENPRLDSWPEDYPIRPGMFGRVELDVGTVEAAVVIPESALVHDGPDGDFVFVEVEPGVFAPRDVSVGVSTDDRVQILDGVQAGESVAVSGTFLLKSMGRADELGEGHEH